MSLRITNIGLWVHDQDEALAWYTEKLGFELREDVTLPEFGDYRWLTVGPEDCRATYEELSGRGVEFSLPPTEQPYGIDAQLRDVSGNEMRLVQRTDV